MLPARLERQPRTLLVALKINAAEKAALESLAQQAGMGNVSDLLREAVNVYQTALTAKGRHHVDSLAEFVGEAVRKHAKGKR